MATRDSLVMGIDFGTDSVRAVLINSMNGQMISSSVFSYPRWRDGRFCHLPSNQFRQHPLDYTEGLTFTIRDCLNQAGSAGLPDSVRGISIDTTGSSPVAVNRQGIPLALLPGFENNPNAMFILWKDHTAVLEAAQINAHAKSFPVNYLQFVGGIYSSEWFWAKLLHILRVDEQVRNACYSWVEHCDWIPFLLTGGRDIHQMKRGVCAAGHKALWASAFGGLPPNDFFSRLDPLLEGFTSRLYSHTYPASQPAGTLSKEWADRLGLSTQVVIGVGAFDAHMGAVGGQISPYQLSKVMGTSTCDMLVAPMEEVEGKLISGICGQVPGSVIPGMMGMEAGQSAFGDSYAWFRDLLAWPLEQFLPQSNWIDSTTADLLIREIRGKTIQRLSEAASQIPLTGKNELAMDWLNGRRTPDANQELKAAISQLNLASDAPAIFRAIAEATCFGAKKIVDRFILEGVPVKGLIGIGGVARKSPFIMQMMADVMNMPIRIHHSDQTCAIGAAMFAATAAGLYPRVEEAMSAMGQGFDLEYSPDNDHQAIYQKRYQQYTDLGNFLEHQPNYS
ncbi:MAG: ribulokinase [Chitinophagaceae bacterium]